MFATGQAELLHNKSQKCSSFSRIQIDQKPGPPSNEAEGLIALVRSFHKHLLEQDDPERAQPSLGNGQTQDLYLKDKSHNILNELALDR